MSELQDPTNFNPKHALDTSNLNEVVGMFREGFVIVLRIHLGNNVAGEPVYGEFTLTEKEVEVKRGEAFIDLLIGKLMHLKDAIRDYKRMQAN